MRVQALVDARRDGRARLDGRQVERDLEPVAGDVGAGVEAADFLFRLQRADAVARLREQGAGELDEWRGEGFVVCGEEGEEGLFDGAVHCWLEKKGRGLVERKSAA